MDSVVKFRAKTEDAERWAAAAAACGLTRSEWLRLTADHAVAGRHDPAALSRELVRLRRDLNCGAGSNLNQALVHANTLARAGRELEAEALHAAVQAAMIALTELKGAITAALAGRPA